MTALASGLRLALLSKHKTTSGTLSTAIIITVFPLASNSLHFLVMYSSKMASLFSKCVRFPIKQLNYVLSVVLVTLPTIPFFYKTDGSVKTNVLYLPIYFFTDSLNNNVAIGC